MFSHCGTLYESHHFDKAGPIMKVEEVVSIPPYINDNTYTSNTPH